MTGTITGTATRTVVEELTDWLTENWDPELTVADWWERLGTSGWAAPTWPVEAYGKGLTRAEGVQVQRAVPQNGEPAMRLAVTAGPSANGLCNLVRETGRLTEAVSDRRGA